MSPCSDGATEPSSDAAGYREHGAYGWMAAASRPRPIDAYTFTHCAPIPLEPQDFARLIFVRSGSIIVLGEFGCRAVVFGDALILGANTLFEAEPQGRATITAVYLDTKYLIDQMFWQHAAILSDRQHAQEFVETIYSEPTQLLRLGPDRVTMLMSKLDKLVALSLEGRPVENFYEIQAAWSSVAHVVAPFVRASEIRGFAERTTTWPSRPRHRRFVPLRAEARKAAELLRADPVRRWSIAELANEVHLSASQLGRVFVNAYGKSPIAYLAMLRAERMACLLRTSDVPIAVIAREVGWNDPAFAARQFRRSVGITPACYRDVHRPPTNGASG